MPIDITSNIGNGSIKPESVFSYSYSEEVTSLSPSDSKGGTGQVSLSAIAVDGQQNGVSHTSSNLLVNNTMTLTDSQRGSVTFQAKSLSLANGAVSVTGDTIQSRLNVTKNAGPIGGPAEASASLLDAINYYCSLVSIEPQFDDSIDEDMALVPVNFIGWTGNVWEYLKMLCSAVSVSLFDDSGFEMYVTNNQLHFRYALNRITDFSDYSSDTSISINAFDAAKSVTVYHYDTHYGVDEVIYELSNYAKDADPEKTFRSSINDTMQVDAGQTLVKRFTMDASLTSINQPRCVKEITRIPPSPYVTSLNPEEAFGEYVVVGSDDLPIEPTEWIALGGKLSVALTETPGEIEVTITAPLEFTMKTAEGVEEDVTNAPYKIGAELDTYPAFWLTGTGVFYNKKEKKFLTGASDSYTAEDEAPTIDNPFIASLHDLSNRGIAAAQAYCGPSVEVNQTIVYANGFGETIGLIEQIGQNKFRFESASYSPSSTQLNGRAYTTVTDFNENWVDATFADFNSAALESPDPQALKFNEFTVIPLMGNN